MRDVDLVGLGQHGHGGRRGVDAPLALGGRHPLHPVHAALVLEHRVRARALHGERDLLVAAGVALAGPELLDGEAPGRGVAQVDLEQVAREQGGLLAAGAGPDLDDRVPVVVRVGLEHRLADLAARGPPSPPRPRGGWPRTSSSSPSAEELLGLVGPLGGVAVARGQVERLAQVGVPLRDLGVAAPVGGQVGLGRAPRRARRGCARWSRPGVRAAGAVLMGSLAGRALPARARSAGRSRHHLDLVRPGRRACARAPARGASAWQATSSWSRSGRRVVSRCSHRPGVMMTCT